MSLYIIPDQGQMDAIAEQCSRAGVTLVNPKTVRELILATDSVPMGVAVVSEAVMLVIARHATMLFDRELPLVLHSVPGLVYPQAWMSLGTAFPPANWMEFVKSTAKSGVLSTTPEQLESRGVGARVGDQDVISRLRGEPTVGTPRPSPMMDHDPLAEPEVGH